MAQIPDSVVGELPREFYEITNMQRAEIKRIAEQVDRLREVTGRAARSAMISGEVPANVTIAYRHLEDASMRLGKALQALDGGESVYDRATTVGA